VFFFTKNNSSDIPGFVKNLVVNEIPTIYNVNSFEDIQLLTPQHKGDIGTEEFNLVLQDALNPTGNKFKVFNKFWRIGDKVMQTKNNYDYPIFNGDIGIIESLTEGGEVVIRMDDRNIIRPTSELSEMVLAYAITIHKSQGSEYPVVVIPVHDDHRFMLQRKLIYTGITRAKKLVVLVGTKNALLRATHNNLQKVRNTYFTERLQIMEKKEESDRDEEIANAPF
jgi:exodeoxyribonuclease V alpha subunit